MENRFPDIRGPLNLDAVTQVVDFPHQPDGSFLPATLRIRLRRGPQRPPPVVAGSLKSVCFTAAFGLRRKLRWPVPGVPSVAGIVIRGHKLDRWSKALSAYGKEKTRVIAAIFFSV